VSAAIFSGWQSHHREAWGRQPLCLGHSLARNPLFSLETLAELIESYPREHYALVHMGAQGDRRLWREGRIGTLPGSAVIDAIAAGRMWLNLRKVDTVDRRYRDVLDGIFEELAERVPGMAALSRSCGILISSPGAQVYYHADLPAQSLWQLHGHKRVFVYPPHAPFLNARDIERIALYEVEVDMPYEPSFDASATVFDLRAGEMLTWPLNAPHRVENAGVLNVSMTMEYWTEEVRRNHMVTMANGILRDKVGLAPRSRATSGAGFWTKAALQAGVRRFGLLEKARKNRRPITFELDRGSPGSVVDINPGAA